MCEELVVLYRKDDYAYCKYETFSLGSKDAKKAHDNIRQIKQDGCQIINVESVTKDEMELFLERINLEIEKYEAMNILDINMIISASDLFNFFMDDGYCLIDNLECATPEIKKLLKDPEELSELKKIKQVPYIVPHLRKIPGVQEVLATDQKTGYMIPMIATGDFFSLDEAKNIFNLDSIETSRNELDCLFALDPVSSNNLSLMKSAKNAKQSDASGEDKIKFEKQKQLMLDKYKAISELVQSYKNTKQQVLEIYFRNSKKM